jgi:hypothetical protein
LAASLRSALVSPSISSSLIVMATSDDIGVAH